jgi:hypothetical protein
MALTITPRANFSLGNARGTLTDVTIGAAGDYSSGVTLTAANLRLGSIQFILVSGSDDITVNWFYDQATGKIRASKTGAATSAVFIEAAGADVAGDVVRVFAIGDNPNKG